MEPASRKRKQVVYEENSDSDFMSEEEVVRKPLAKKPVAVVTKKKAVASKKSKTASESEQKKVDSESESKNVNSDEVVYDANSTKKSTIPIPRPKGAPFPDAISPDSLAFLAELSENNDRDFMQIKAKEWAAVRKDFTDFCQLVMDELVQIDPAVRREEAKAAVYRQHRDLRFTNDKRPYKVALSAGFSRQGRKFQDAGYFLFIKPGNESMMATGMWQPDKHRLANVRNRVITHGDLLREALSTDPIKELFDGKCGMDILSEEDKLKVAPKGIAKDHPEIELLKFKSFAIVKRFTDEEVVSEGFLESVLDTCEACVPFATVINSWI